MSEDLRLKIQYQMDQILKLKFEDEKICDSLLGIIVKVNALEGIDKLKMGLLNLKNEVLRLDKIEETNEAKANIERILERITAMLAKDIQVERDLASCIEIYGIFKQDDSYASSDDDNDFFTVIGSQFLELQSDFSGTSLALRNLSENDIPKLLQMSREDCN